MGHASTYFYDSNDADRQTLHRRIRPSDSQFEEQQGRWNALQAYLLPKLEEASGYGVRSWLQGSYKFGTQVRPVRSGGEFDIDLGVYYCWNGHATEGRHDPATLKAFVQGALKEFASENDDVKSVAAPPKQRCCRVHFDGSFHIDVPCYHLNAGADTRALATEKNEWEYSDPKALYQWFTSKFDDASRDRVRRFVRYVKAWAALKRVADSDPPPSVLITVLVANAFVDLGDDASGPDDEVFARIINAVLNAVSVDREVTNPVDKSEDLAGRMSDESWGAFVDGLKALSQTASDANKCDTAVAACSTWANAFEHLFPLPEDEALGKDVRNLPVPRTLPEVEVRATSKDNRNFSYAGVNGIGPIPKNCTIDFRVMNVGYMPPGTRFVWTVRNEGDEAEDVNDLGHRAGYGLSAEERSAYNGTHYMDCAAVVGNRLVGVRRVKVTVRGEKVPRRHPLRKPAYVSFRTRR